MTETVEQTPLIPPPISNAMEMVADLRTAAALVKPYADKLRHWQSGPSEKDVKKYKTEIEAIMESLGELHDDTESLCEVFGVENA